MDTGPELSSDDTVQSPGSVRRRRGRGARAGADSGASERKRPQLVLKRMTLGLLTVEHVWLQCWRALSLGALRRSLGCGSSGKLTAPQDSSKPSNQKLRPRGSELLYRHSDSAWMHSKFN